MGHVERYGSAGRCANFERIGPHRSASSSRSRSVLAALAFLTGLGGRQQPPRGVSVAGGGAGGRIQAHGAGYGI